MTNSHVYNPATWLDQFFSDFDKVAVGNTKGNFNPNVDILEEKENFVLRVELPGIPKENIKVEVKENRLILSGKKESSTEQFEGQYRHVESKVGPFSRSFELPRTVSGDDIRAEYQNGVLVLKIPKAKEAQSKSIEIK